MLHHHDSRSYATAASEAASHARAKMEAVIAKGGPSASRVCDVIQNRIPEDRVARGRALRFGFAAHGAMKHAVDLGDAAGLVDDATGLPAAVAAVLDNRDPLLESTKSERPMSELLVSVADETKLRLHDHAFAQMCSVAKAPNAYVRELIESREPRLQQLAVEILNRHFREASLSEKDVPEARFLLRAVEGQVRGFLSDRYRRLDSRPLLMSFAEACQKVGAVPVDGVISDTRVQVKAYLPMIFEPVPNEVMLVGLAWSNSDFGNGTHRIDLTVLRLWCTNKATIDTALRNVHIGGRLGDDITFSAETYAKDTAATASAIGDVVTSLLAPARVNALLDAIREADARKVNWTEVSGRLAKVVGKDDLALIGKLATECDDVAILPPVHDGSMSAWRASNALSWFAGQTKDADKQLQLEQIAGDLLGIKAADLVATKQAA